MNQNTVTGNENQEKKSRQVLRADQESKEENCLFHFTATLTVLPLLFTI